MDVHERTLYSVMLEELEKMDGVEVANSVNFYGRCGLFRFVGSISISLKGTATMADVVERLAGNEYIGRPYGKAKPKPASKSIMAYKRSADGDWNSRDDQVFLTTSPKAADHLKDEGYMPIPE